VLVVDSLVEYLGPPIPFVTSSQVHWHGGRERGRERERERQRDLEDVINGNYPLLNDISNQ